MALRSDRQHWGAVAKTFHWLIAALILAQVALGATMVSLPRRPSVIGLYDLHKSIGLTILALALLRLAWRAIDRHPERPTAVSRRHYRLGRGMHATLYLLLIITPLSGWLFDSATALRPLHWWGIIDLPNLTGGPAPAWAPLTRTLHHVLAWALVTAALIHTLAALVHHGYYRDMLLRRMLPGYRHRRTGGQ